MAEKNTNIALLIDFDNMAIGAEDSLKSRFELDKVMEAVREKGRIIVKRAYADWKVWSSYQSSMISNAIDMVHLPKHGVSNKNMADIRMTVDALEIVYRNSLIDTFVLLTGDSDFSHLVSRLRENGKYVITIGVRAATSDLLIFNSDEFISYDSIASPSKTKDVDDGCIILVDVLMAADHGSMVRISGVKDLMLRKDPSFNERDFGFRQFKDFILEARRRGYIEIDESRGTDLYLRGLTKDPYEDSGGSPAIKRRAPSGRAQAKPSQPRGEAPSSGARPAPSRYRGPPKRSQGR